MAHRRGPGGYSYGRGTRRKLLTSSARECETTGTVFFHEDDYCQVEVLPASACGYCLTEMAASTSSLRHTGTGPGSLIRMLRPTGGAAGFARHKPGRVGIGP